MWLRAVVLIVIVGGLLVLGLGRGRSAEAQSPAPAPGEDRNCIECHPESKERLLGEHNHPPFEGDECLSCHRGHGFQPRVVLQGSIYSVCTECHGELVDLPEESIHPPLLDDDSCLTCHGAHGTPYEKLLIEEGGAVCLPCHDGPTEDAIHPPYVELRCPECHSPHGSVFPRQFTMPIGYVCLSCHQEDFPGADPAAMHAADPERSCDNCHSGHEGTRSLLHESPPALCGRCHGDIVELAASGPAHSILEGGECLECHDPHFGGDRSAVIEAIPDLCFTCHDGISERLESAVVHPPAEDGCLDCHDPHRRFGEGEANELCLDCHDLEEDALVQGHFGIQATSCTGCHDPHGAGAAGLLLASMHPPFEDGECDTCHETKILSADLQDPELCLTCHEEPGGEHPSAEAGACVDCHSPHASSRRVLLRGGD